MTYLHVVAAPSAWIVVEDDRAQPFVAGVRQDESTTAIAATMTRDSFRFVVPANVTDVRFAVNFDSWWHAWDAEGHALGALRDDRGQLVLNAAGLEGKHVTIHFGDAATETAIALSVATQTAILMAFAALGLRRQFATRRLVRS